MQKRVCSNGRSRRNRTPTHPAAPHPAAPAAAQAETPRDAADYSAARVILSKENLRLTLQIPSRYIAPAVPTGRVVWWARGVSDQYSSVGRLQCISGSAVQRFSGSAVQWYVLALVLSTLVALPVNHSWAQVLDRKREPVVIQADSNLFSDWVDQNVAVADLELWRYRNGSWSIAPFQIDELQTDGQGNVVPLQVQDPRTLNDAICRASAPPVPPGAAGPCEFQYQLRGQSLGTGEFNRKDELVFLAVVVAVDTSGNESSYSNEVVVQVP